LEAYEVSGIVNSPTKGLPQCILGALSSALVFGERFGPVRLFGMACVLAGLAVIVAPVLRSATPRGGGR
jgi:O-acetylserine/cysteine efflux transporter